jgi:hypothetical protein
MVEKFIYTTGSMPAEGHQPSHPGILSVRFRAGDFQSELIAEKVSTYTLDEFFSYVYVYHHNEQSFKRGDAICKFDKYRPGERRTRTSIQLGEAEHCELNNDLVFGTPATRFCVT